MGIEPFICALNGGEDYELLFTMPLNLYDRLLGIRDLHVIGHMTGADAGTKFITSHESEIQLQPMGWNSV